MTDKLKPCPFCGGEAYLTPSGVIAYCSNTKECDATVNPQRGQREAIAAWNNRSPSPRIEALEAVARAASVYRRGESTAVDLFDAVDALDKLEVA